MKIQVNSKTIDRALSKSMSYGEYRELINTLLDAGETTGADQSESRVFYTALNTVRMKKWDKHFKLQPDVEKMLRLRKRKEVWLMITEAWCGDAAHAVPVIHKMASVSEAIDLKIVLRDEHPDLMDLFLTNGSRSIPKLIRLDAATHEVISTWGPRPEELKAIFEELKEAGTDAQERKEALQLWYAKNKGKAIEREIAAILAPQTVNSEV